MKRWRQAQVLFQQLSGLTTQQIATRSGLSLRTVKYDLAQAKKNGLLDAFEDQLLAELVPKAQQLYTKALNDGDLFVAKDVMSHAGRIADRTSKEQAHKAGMSMQLWLQLRREQNALQEDGEEVDALPAATPETYSGELLLTSSERVDEEEEERINAELAKRHVPGLVSPIPEGVRPTLVGADVKGRKR